EAALRDAAQRSDPREQTQSLRRAIALYRGELLPGYYEDWIIAERERLAEAYRGALGQLATLLENAGGLSRSIEIARRALALDPLWEEAHCTLMRLYAAAGRRSDALRQYHELERVLREELEAAPSAAARELADVIKAGVQVFGCSGVQVGTTTHPPP